MQKQLAVAFFMCWFSIIVSTSHHYYEGPKLEKTVEAVVGRLMSDVGSNLYNLFSIDSLKILTAGFPFYLIARPIDHKIHHKTYDPEHHKNKHEPGHMFTTVFLNAGCVAIPIAFAGLFSSDPYRIRRAEVFTTGVLMTWASKNILKILPTEANIRPWNEHFRKDDCVYGGNPSGHTALLGYCTAFWAMEKGAALGIPLTALTLVSMGLAVAGNRHYVSQVIAGATYGVMFGVATHRTFEKTVLNPDTKISMIANKKDGIGFKLSYAF